MHLRPRRDAQLAQRLQTAPTPPSPRTSRADPQPAAARRADRGAQPTSPTGAFVNVLARTPSTLLAAAFATIAASKLLQPRSTLLTTPSFE